MKLTNQDIRRFWTKVEKRSDGECWNWTGTGHPSGYGRIKIGRTNILAHRLSFLLNFSVDPGEMCVCHHCDNRLCINPNHLFLGTRTDNNIDMMAKGRGDWSLSCKGSQHGQSRFTEEQIIEIRRLWSRGGLTQKNIALRFQTRQSVISRIVNGVSWSHVKEAA